MPCKSTSNSGGDRERVSHRYGQMHPVVAHQLLKYVRANRKKVYYHYDKDFGQIKSLLSAAGADILK